VNEEADVTQRPDHELARTARQGDREAYAELVRRHLKRVFSITLGILGEIPDAEDAAQEVFVKGFEKIGSLRDDDRFASWIGQVARNRCRDILRSRARRPETALTPALENRPADAGEDYGALRSALARLSEEDRLPLLLYYYDGKDTSTLATEMGLSQGGACTKLYRARRRLRALLEEVAS
jgi:RNA polymerase sigma-70 factor (ECF subfamily)